MTIPLIYIYNLLITFIILIICNTTKIFKHSYLILITTYYIMILGQRWAAGVDFIGYYRYYLTGFKAEYGYYIIQQFFSDNNFDFGVLIFIIYTFTTIISLWFFRKFTTSNLSIFLFFLSEYHIMSINPLRTYIALNIFLIGVYFFEFKEKKYKALIIMFVGALFHLSIIPASLIYLLFKVINILKFRQVINIILVGLPLVNFTFIIRYVVSILLPKYIHYFGSTYDVSFSSANIIRYYIILACFLYFQNFFSLKNKKESLILFGMYILLILMGISTNFAPLHRVAYYFKIFEPIFFIYMLDYKKIGKTGILIIIAIFMFNYIGIIYKDMGLLRHYEFKSLQLFDKKNKSEMYQEYYRISIGFYD